MADDTKLHRHLNSILSTSTAAAFVALVLVTALILCALLYSSSSSTSSASSSPLLSAGFILRSLSGAVSSASDRGQIEESSHSPGTNNLDLYPPPPPSSSNSSSSCSSSLSPRTNPSSDDPSARGRWVYDESYPIYESEACPFIDEGFRCSENGRPDLGYLKWRWSWSRGRGDEKEELRIPDAAALLARLRGQRVVFVGDSIGRNQWESLLCILARGVADKRRIFEEHGQPITKHTGFLSFRFADYDATIEYYRSPFLVPQTRPPRGSPAGVRSALHVDAIDWTAPRWRGARLLVFNAGHWWNYEKTLRGGCFFAVKNKVNVTMAVKEAFSRAIHTWGNWIRANINTSDTAVFFRSYSSVHFRNGTWRSGGQCDGETMPAELRDGEDEREAWTTQIVRDAVAGLPGVRLLDIGAMTDLRKDGHPSRWYRGRSVGPAPSSKQDCSHWCLPGVPDTWNLLLLHHLWQDL